MTRITRSVFRFETARAEYGYMDSIVCTYEYYTNIFKYIRRTIPSDILVNIGYEKDILCKSISL